ncbi:MAG: hypothetical protein J5679_02320 [Alphaproteobacteria bacterium]|nr:hypothetical protein [Alphaproteobacteria bacterium]
MRNETKMKLMMAVAGIVLFGGGVALGTAIKGKGKANDSSDLQDQIAIESARADSAEANAKTLIVEKDRLAQDLALANDSIIVLNDMVVKADSLQHANDSLQYANDSIMAELNDCKASKEAVKKTTTAKKTTTTKTTTAKQPAKSADKQPVKSAEKPQEQVATQEPEQITSGSTTVNVNTPNNVINISNGGVINNYAQDSKCTEQQCIEEYKKAQQAYQDGFVPTGRRVRCK